MTPPELHITNLQTEVPPGWSLTGLSAPRSDGVNLYRAPTAASSHLTFTTSGAKFVQFRYQLFSSREAVTGRVRLNGQVLDTFTFPWGRFVNQTVSGFAQDGTNTLTLDYLCGSSPCRNVPINQYWTQLSLVQPQAARRDLGLGVEEWRLDAPETLLISRGTGPTAFDGVNYFRSLPSYAFSLGWPEGVQVLNASFQVYANEPVRVTTSVAGQVISRKRGDKAVPVVPTLSLVKYPGVRSLQVQVECLAGRPGCAQLYFARVSVVPAAIRAEKTPLLAAGAVLLILAALLGLAWWLRLLPPASRRPA